MEAVPAAATAAGGGGPAAPRAGAGRDNVARPAAAATAATTPEEEALKRNTDCVYFLASPLTCKKGADCEYRHSEGARVNPRDCYYWLNGNCLNPKCSFRHPPLEGLFGTDATSSGPLLSPQAAAPTQAASHTSRQSVPCYYFQRGLCLKGDRCPFSHGVTSTSNPVLHQTPKLAAQVADHQQTIKKPSWAIDKCNQNVPKRNVTVPVVAPTSSKRVPAGGTKNVPANGLPAKNNIQLKTELPSRSETNNVSRSTGNAVNRLQSHQSHPEVSNVALNTRNVPNRLQTHQSDLADEQLQYDGDEFMHESSPGFDVLVDDENEDPGYYHTEDDYRDPSGNDGKSFKPLTEFDYSQNSDYENAATRFSRERLREESEYDDVHMQLRDSYDRERRVSSSDRILERAPAPKRSRREDSMSEVDGSDLRHKLKQRRLNGRSGFSPDQPSDLYKRTDHYTEEQRHGSRRRRDDQHQAPGRISLSKRLQGRISLPGRMPAQTDPGISDKAADPGMDWVGRPSGGLLSTHQVRSRVRQRSSEEFPYGERRTGVNLPKTEEAEESEFTRPKRLSELRGAKVSGISDPGANGASKDSLSADLRLRKALGNHQETESADFEGPKSLSDILKRKREAAGFSHCKDSGDDNRSSGGLMMAAAMATEEAGSVNSVENAAVEEEEGLIPLPEQGEEGQYDETADANENEFIEDQNGEYEQGNDGYEYEQNEEFYYEDEDGAYQGEGAYPEDGAYQEDEGVEQEDGSSGFAGKLDEPLPD